MTVVWSGFQDPVGLGGLAGGPHLDAAIQSTTEQIALQKMQGTSGITGCQKARGKMRAGQGRGEGAHTTAKHCFCTAGQDDERTTTTPQDDQAMATAASTNRGLVPLALKAGVPFRCGAHCDVGQTMHVETVTTPDTAVGP